MSDAGGAPSGAFGTSSLLVGFAKDLIAGTLGGTAGIVAGQPADTVKVRVQSASGAVQPTILVARDMLRKEGPTSFFRGMLAPLVANAPINAIIFSVYGGVVRKIQTKSGRDPNLVEQLLAGAAGGAAQSVVACPSELIKIQQQIEVDSPRGTSPAKSSGGGGALRGAGDGGSAKTAKHKRVLTSKRYTTLAGLLHSGRRALSVSAGAQQRGIASDANNSSWSLVTNRVHQAGIWRGAFQGWNATLLRDVPAFGAYFFSYEWFKRQFERLVDPVSRIRITWLETTFPSFMAGGLAGVVSWTVTMPMDVIKSRVQSEHWDAPRRKRAWLSVARSGFEEEGTKYFFRGMAPALLRAFPVSAVVFTVYEWVMRHLDSWEQNNVSNVPGLGDRDHGNDNRELKAKLGLPEGREDDSEFRRKSTRKMSELEIQLGLPPLQHQKSGPAWRRPGKRAQYTSNHDAKDNDPLESSSQDLERLIARGSDYRRSAQEIALGLPPLRVRDRKKTHQSSSKAAQEK